MKSFAKIAFVGFSGVVLFKLFASIFLPLIGLLVGLFVLAIKVAVFAAIIYFLYSLFFKRDEDEDEELSADGEIVVEAAEGDGPEVQEAEVEEDE